MWPKNHFGSSASVCLHSLQRKPAVPLASVPLPAVSILLAVGRANAVSTVCRLYGAGPGETAKQSKNWPKI